MNTEALNAGTLAREIGRFRQLMAHLWLVGCLALTPSIALATPIEDGVNWVVDLLTNGIARSVAIIGIALLGYAAWAGRITGQACGMYIAGIVLVFGGASIVDLLIATVS